MPIMTEQTQTFTNVFDALADTPQEAANLRARAELARALSALVAANGWTQAEAARRCGVTQPRMNDLLRGRISRFSLDALVNMAVGCGQRVRVACAGSVCGWRWKRRPEHRKPGDPDEQLKLPASRVAAAARVGYPRREPAAHRCPRRPLLSPARAGAGGGLALHA